MNIFKSLRNLSTKKGEREFVAWALDYVKAHGVEDFLRLMRNRIGIPITLPIDALWRVHAVDDVAYRHLPKSVRSAIWRSGNMESMMLNEKFNKIMDAYKFAIIANNIGTPTADQHLQMDYVAVGTRDLRTGIGVPATTEDIQLGNEFYRGVPDERYRATSSLVVILYLDASEANPTNTTVASGASETVFTVQAGQGTNYAQHDVIRVFTTTYETVVVDSVSTDTITLKSSTPLSVTPTADMLVERLFGECGMFCGQATSTRNSGTFVNHADLRFPKNNATSILLEVHLNYLTQN